MTNNVFLYAARDSEVYRQVEHALHRICSQSRLIALPPGSQFTSPLCLELRSNDIIILFARDEAEINDLLALRDEYESFRIVLIVENQQRIPGTKYALLTPRFVYSLDDNLDELKDYLQNVLKRNG